MPVSLKQLALKYLPDVLLEPLRSRHYEAQLRNYPMTTEPDLLGCKALLRPGDTVFDVGANIGVYTRFCAEFVGPAGQVHSLEPVPATFRYLTRNVRALHLGNVTCHNLAASDQDQQNASMSMPDYPSGGANIYEARLSASGGIPVRTARLDTLFPELCPRLIKCDVEGHELACIEGALRLIARCRPVWLVEVSSPRTFDRFSALDYDPWLWTDGAFRRAAQQDKVPNYFFVPREHPPL